MEKIREAMAALEAEAQAAAEQAEAEGGKHPGVPDDKAQRNFTDTESRIIPAPGGKDFCLLQYCLRRLFLLVRWVTVPAQNTADWDPEVGLDVLAKRPSESRGSLIRTSPNR